MPQKKAAWEADMRSKDRIHAEHEASRKQGIDDAKTPVNESLNPDLS